MSALPQPTPSRAARAGTQNHLSRYLIFVYWKPDAAEGSTALQSMVLGTGSRVQVKRRQGTEPGVSGVVWGGGSWQHQKGWVPWERHRRTQVSCVLELCDIHSAEKADSSVSPSRTSSLKN